MTLGNLDWDDETERRPIIIAVPMPQEMPQTPQYPQQPTNYYPQEPPQPQKQSITRRLVQGTKNKLLRFHQDMLERKRRNAEMKKTNPKAYAKLVAERKENWR